MGLSGFSLPLACLTLTRFVLTFHSGIWAITMVPYWLTARKKNNFHLLFLSRWAQQSQLWPSFVPHCSELTGRLGGIGVGVTLIS